MEDDEALPEHLRCSRTDGRQWRCSRRVIDNKKLCELHHLQGRLRQYKKKVPDSLKLQRKRHKTLNKASGLHNLEIRAQKGDKTAKRVKRRRSVGVSEALDEALKKMKLKKGDLRLELIRMLLQRQVERRKKRDLEASSEGEWMRDLPNGLMAISPAPLPRHFANAGPFCEVKIGIDSGSFTRRCFRSKNIEPLPIGSLQVVPFVRNVANLRRGRRTICHWCLKSGFRSLIKCSSCQKEFFCMDCIKERYFNTQEGVKMACPVCCGTCSCKACLANQSRDIDCKEFLRDRSRVERIQHFHYMICMLLPVLEQINQDQRIELEKEAKIKGKKPSEVQVQLAEFSYNRQRCCNNCKTSIVDFHRSCPNCSYDLCLSCCRDLLQGSIPGGIKAFISEHSNKKKACLSDDKRPRKTKQIRASKQSFGFTYLAPVSLPDWKVCNGDGSISCPPAEVGGCCNSLLDLKCVFPFSWTKELEISAEEIVCSYDFSENFDAPSCCSLCLDMDHKAGRIKQLQEAATREDSNDNFLYYPVFQDVHGDNLEHFQKHWGKGHPVIVRNVLQSTSDLSWDPIVIFCTYLESSSANSENDIEAVKATNCLDWCELEIGIRQLFVGSLEGQTHASMWRETLKLKCWLSSHLFQEQFPAHYAEIIRALPLQEYMNPKSGLLNLAVKLPQEIRTPDLGPFIYISYGTDEELLQADSVKKLCYDSNDVVNILAHTTDVPISTEQLTKIRKLMKKHKAQDQRESTTMTNDQKMAFKVKGNSSLHSESMEKAGLMDMIGAGLHLHKGVAGVSWFSAASHEACAVVKDGIMSHAGEYDSDSEASILCSGTIQSSEKSDDQKFHRDYIESSNCFGKKSVAKSCGAQWDVFRRQDVPKLLEYLKRHSSEFSHTCGFPKHVVHPILDQSFFLDSTHKMRLKEEFKIEPWTFEQHVGEAVVIPAGCPYQSRNLKSCVNVVLDFVSPENATECIQLIDELRLLPEDHKAKEDKLEVKKMTLYSISAAIKEIRELTCPKTSGELKEKL